MISFSGCVSLSSATSLLLHCLAENHIDICLKKKWFIFFPPLNFWHSVNYSCHTSVSIVFMVVKAFNQVHVNSLLIHEPCDNTFIACSYLLLLLLGHFLWPLQLFWKSKLILLDVLHLSHLLVYFCICHIFWVAFFMQASLTSHLKSSIIMAFSSPDDGGFAFVLFTLLCGCAAAFLPLSFVYALYLLTYISTAS